MLDLSLHILDIVENSTAAGATCVEINIDEDTRENVLVLEIKDNGSGIEEETQKKILDPFYTTRKTREVGLGIPMLAQSAREAEGELKIESRTGKGTTITARFVYNHIDRKPLGNIAETILALLTGAAVEVDLVYRHTRDGDGFVFDTREVKAELQEVPINHPEVLNYLRDTINQGLEELGEPQG